ncbi:MAG: response regulator transcription factor [Eubacteriales bacterium]|nr:response regulator transcription factor [Eubacteriales bacterium]
MKKIKVLVADDQELTREGLRIVLEKFEDMEVIDAVRNGTEVIRSVHRQQPDVILMDIRMPGMDGVTCTRIIKENYPDIRIIVLTTFDDDEYVFNALRDGASGYLLKGISVMELAEAIRKVNSGSAMINPDIATKVLAFFSEMAKNSFSIQVNREMIGEIGETERAIIRLISRGYSNKEIAAELNFSEGTIRNYLSTILCKLGLRDRTQLAIWAVQPDGRSGAQECLGIRNVPE